MKRISFLLSAILFLAIVACQKSEFPSGTEAVSSEDSFENWADARSGRWFSYAVYKAVKEHPDAPKEELYRLVSSYLEPVVNARKYYSSKISNSGEYSGHMDIDDYLSAEYRKNYFTLDKRVNNFKKLDHLYTKFLKLPKVQERTKQFSIRLQMGEMDPVDVIACGIFFIGDFLDPLYSYSNPSDYYFFSFFPPLPKRRLKRY